MFVYLCICVYVSMYVLFMYVIVVTMEGWSVPLMGKIR